MNPLQASLPTDSLYKFMALAGVAIVLASTIMLNRIAQQRSEEAFRVADLTAAHNAAAHQLMFRFEIREASEAALYAFLGESGERQPPADLRMQVGAMEPSEKQQFYAAVTDLFHERERLLNLAAHLDGLDRDRRWLYVLFVTLAILGASVATWGFALWYCRVQRYVDAALRNGPARGA